MQADIMKKKTNGISAHIFTKQWIKIYFSPTRILPFGLGSSGHVLSRMETRASSQNYCVMFVVCHKQRIISVNEDTNEH